jgi:hypothetical protein
VSRKLTGAASESVLYVVVLTFIIVLLLQLPVAAPTEAGFVTATRAIFLLVL